MCQPVAFPTGFLTHPVVPLFLSYPSYANINSINFFFLLSYSFRNFFRVGEGVIMDYPIWTLFIYIYLSSTYINRLRYILLLYLYLVSYYNNHISVIFCFLG